VTPCACEMRLNALKEAIRLRSDRGCRDVSIETDEKEFGINHALPFSQMESILRCDKSAPDYLASVLSSVDVIAMYKTENLGNQTVVSRV